MARIYRSSTSRRDLAGIVEFVARENPRAAAALLDRIDRAVKALAANPPKGPVHRERGGSPTEQPGWAARAAEQGMAGGSPATGSHGGPAGRRRGARWDERADAAPRWPTPGVDLLCGVRRTQEGSGGPGAGTTGCVTAWTKCTVTEFAPKPFPVPRELRPCYGPVRSLLCACYFRSEEHTSELQSLMRISYAVFCLTKKKTLIYTKKTNRKNKEHTKRLYAAKQKEDNTN